MADYLDQAIARERLKQRPAAFTAPVVPRSTDLPASYIGGFVSSAISSVPELFGAKPAGTAQAFRDENPWMGFASQIIAPIGVYSAGYKASKLPSIAPKLEKAVENVVGRFGLEAAEAPVRAGMVRETLRYAPVEAARLIGGTVTGAYDPLANPFGEGGIFQSDLFQDVALSTIITGGVGGLGGYFRIGGKRGAQPSHVQGAEIQLSPTHQLKMLLDEGAEIVGDVSKPEYIAKLRDTILKENAGFGATSGRKLPHINTIDGATADDINAINSLFQTSSKKAADAEKGLLKQRLDEGPETNIASLNEGEQALIVQALPENFSTIDDVAKELVFPRVATAVDKNGARALSGILARPAFQRINETTLIAREKDGAFIVAHRFLEGTPLSKGKAAAKHKVGVGDKWLIGKSTNPGAFAPEAKALGDQTMAQWAKWGTKWQPNMFNDVFNNNADMLLKAMSPVDYHDLKNMDRGTWVSRFTAKLGEKATKEGGFLDTTLAIRDSKSLRDAADWIYDTFKPTMFLEHQDSMFGRFFGTMRNSMRVGERYATTIMRGAERIKPGGRPSQALRGKNVEYVSAFRGHRPVQEVVNDLSPEEVNLVAHLSNGSKLSVDEVKVLVAEGQLSQKAANAVEELRAINQDVIDDLIMPVFKHLPRLADTAWIESHLGIPRLFKGDVRVEVKNEKGQLVHLAVGKNGAAAQREAKAVVDEATAQGKKWSFDAARTRHILDPDAKDLEKMQEALPARLATAEDEAAIIYKAMRRLGAIKSTSGKNPSIPMTSGTLKKRTGVKGSPDVQTFTHEDVLSAMDGHLRTLLKFAGMQSWRERFGTMAISWGKDNPSMFNNLMRKSNQYLGLEGQLTNALNKTLTPLFGTALGGKAATKIAAATNEVMYNWNLALVNPTFALLNLLTPLQTVAPWIAHMTRAPGFEAAKMMQFIPTYNQLGKPTGAAGVMEPLKILGQSMKLMRDPGDELQGFIHEALDDGLFNPQLFEEWVGRKARAAQTLRDAWDSEGMVGFLRRGSTYMAEQSEKFSRLAAFNSAYLVGKNHFGMSGDQLYRFMRRGTEVTMFNYGTVDRSRIFTGPVGSMFGLFKNWQMHFMGNMLQYAGLAARQNVWAPLVWQSSAALALGGLGATPLRHMADGLAKWAADAPSGFQYMQENWGDLADPVYFGLPGFLGISLQASSSIPGTDVRNEIGHLTSFVAVERGKAIAKSMGAAWDYYQANGVNALQNPNIRDSLLSALAPRAAFRAASSIEGDYVKSMSTGYPMVSDVSPAGRLLHGLGMNTTEIERHQVAAKELWKDQTARRELIQNMGMAYADAQMSQDYDQLERIINRGIALQLPIDSIMQSSMTRVRRETESDNLSRFDADLANRYRTALED